MKRFLAMLLCLSMLVCIQFGTHIGDYTYLPRNLIIDRDLPIESTYQAAAGLLNDTLQRIYDCYK